MQQTTVKLAAMGQANQIPANQRMSQQKNRQIYMFIILNMAWMNNTVQANK